MNYYELLGVHRASSADDINKAFHRLVWVAHPDRGGDPQKFTDLRTAKATLIEPKLREDYDRMLKREFIACECCNGKGYHARQKSFAVRIYDACDDCGGSGYIN